MLSKLPSIREVAVECYAGDCSRCPGDSLVCSGVGGEGDWWVKSRHLPPHKVQSLEMNANDKRILDTILEVRLSEQAVLSVTSGTSTQKCEAYNRGTLSVLPKEVNLARNFAGPLASKTLQLNNSLQYAVEQKTENSQACLCQRNHLLTWLPCQRLRQVIVLVKRRLNSSGGDTGEKPG